MTSGFSLRPRAGPTCDRFLHRSESSPVGSVPCALLGVVAAISPFWPCGSLSMRALKIIENYGKLGVGGSWLILASISRLATSSEFRVAMLPEQSMT